MPQTIRLHRVIKAPPERVYRAFTTPEAMVKWLPPHGFAAQVHEFDARVGGRYRMSFINFSANSQNSFGGEFLELVPGQRIRHTDRFEDPNLPGEMITTVNLKAVICGNGCKLRSGVDGAAERQPAMRGGYKAEAQLPSLCLMPAIEKHGRISTQLLLSGCHDLPDEIGNGFCTDAQRLLIIRRKAP